MRSLWTRCRRALYVSWVGLFTFTMVSTSFPSTVHAEPPLEAVRGDLVRLQSELRIHASALTEICESLLRTHHYAAVREAKQKESLFATHGTKQTAESCETCDQLKDYAKRLQPFPGVIDPNDPLGSLMGMFNTSELFQPEQRLWRSEAVSEHRFDHLVQGMIEYKQKVETYLEIQTDPLIQALVLSSYIKLVSQYMVVDLLVYPLDDAFDRLDTHLSLEISEETLSQIRNYLSEPDESEEEEQSKFGLQVMINFERNKNPLSLKPHRIVFSDRFRIDVELNSYLRQQNEASWLNVLKLVATRYLAKQLLHITTYWPEIGRQNEAYFGYLSRFFRSFKNKFNSILETKKMEKDMGYNIYLAEHLFENALIPTVITADRYMMITQHAAHMRHFGAEEVRDYIVTEERNFIEDEKEHTRRVLRDQLSQFHLSLMNEPLITQARWIRDKIIEIKEDYIHTHIIEKFVNSTPPEMSPHAVAVIRDRIIADYEDELSLEDVSSWMATFDNPTGDIHAGEAFRTFSALELPIAALKIKNSEDHIRALLLRDFHSAVAWSNRMAEFSQERAAPGRTHYAGNGIELGSFWTSSGIENREMKLTMPPTPEAYKKHQADASRSSGYIEPWPDLGSVKNVMPVENFPEVPKIAFTEENFRILTGILIGPVGQDVHLLKHGLKEFGQISKDTNDDGKITVEDKRAWKQTFLQKFDALIEATERYLTLPREEVGGFQYYLWYKPRMFFGSDPYEKDGSVFSAEKSTHEKEAAQKTLDELKKIKKRIKDIDINNGETLDDFFTSTTEKVEFLKTKRAVEINQYRLFGIKLTTYTGKEEYAPQEKELITHYLELTQQDGVLVSEVYRFLGSQDQRIRDRYHEVLKEVAKKEHPYPIQNLSYICDLSQPSFQQKHDDALKAFFGTDKSPSEIQAALHDNERIIRRLRVIESKIDSFWNRSTVPHEAYNHPEYFVGSAKVPQPITNLLIEAKKLREERKTAYLDKGGARFDRWLKSYLFELMIREAFIEQDLLIRKNIYEIVTATRIEDIREYILDPHILNDALKTIQEEFASERDMEQQSQWRIEAYRQMHTDLAKEYEGTALDRYHDGSFHNWLFWGGTALMVAFIALASLTGVGAIPAYVISCILLAEFAATQTVDLYESFVEAPNSIQRRKDFYFSAASSMMEGGPGDYQQFDQFDEMVRWKQLISVGSTALFVIPWARSEVKQGIRLFHQQTSLFVRFKIAHYSKQLGLKKVEEMTLPTIRQTLAQKLGLTAHEVGTKSATEIKTLLTQRFGGVFKGEAERLFGMYQFFYNPQIAQFMKLQVAETIYQSLERLGFEEGMYPNLEEIKAQGIRALDGNANQLFSSTQIEPTYMKLLNEERNKIKDALRYLETNYGDLANMRYATHPRQALEALGLTIQDLTHRDLFDAIYMTAIGNPDRTAAYFYLNHLYQMTPEQVRALQAQLTHGASLGLQTQAIEEALDIITHFPRNAEWYIPQMMGR